MTQGHVETVEKFLADIRTGDGVFAVDDQQRITYLNDEAARILGCEMEEVLGQPCYEVVAGRDPWNNEFCRRNCPVVTSSRKGQSTPAYDVITAGADGEPCWVNTSIMVMDSPQDGSSRIVHVIRDVTRRRHMEESARKAAVALRIATDGEEEEQGVPREVANGSLPQLSRRETDVLRLLAQGMSNRQIAQTLFISPITARNHVDRLIAKLGVESRLQAVLYASWHRMI